MILLVCAVDLICVSALAWIFFCTAVMITNTDLLAALSQAWLQPWPLILMLFCGGLYLMLRLLVTHLTFGEWLCEIPYLAGNRTSRPSRISRPSLFAD